MNSHKEAAEGPQGRTYFSQQLDSLSVYAYWDEDSGQMKVNG